MTRLLDIVMGYDCNLACDYCTITPEMRKRSLSAAEIAAALRRAYRHGVREVSFTGGEPTIRGDLLALVREAKRLGYEDIKVQSNGLLFTPQNVVRLREAGVTRFHVSVHTHLRDAYLAMVRRDGAYDAMVAGLRTLADAPLDVPPVADLIMTRQTAPRLADAIGWLHHIGIRRARLWLVSLTDGNANRPESLLSFGQLLPHVHAAFRAAESFGTADGEVFELRSLHLPHCVLGEDARYAEDPAAGGVRLLTPDDERDLADAKLTPGAYVPACEGCEVKGECRGLRPDYLALHGDGDVAAARGVDASVPATKLPLVER